MNVGMCVSMNLDMHFGHAFVHVCAYELGYEFVYVCVYDVIYVYGHVCVYEIWNARVCMRT